MDAETSWADVALLIVEFVGIGLIATIGRTEVIHKLLAIIPIVLFACGSGSDVMPTWSPDRVTGELADQLYQDSVQAWEARVQADSRYVAIPHPVRPQVGDWDVSFETASTWLVDTGSDIHRVFTNGIKPTRVGPSATQATAEAGPPAWSILPLEIGQHVYINPTTSSYVDGWLEMKNCVLGPGRNPDSEQLGSGARGRVVETRAECQEGLLRLEGDGGTRWWVNWEEVEVR